MTDVTNRVEEKWKEGGSQRSGLYAIKGCTAGDTFDLAAFFYQVKQAIMMGDTIMAGVTLAAAAASTTRPVSMTLMTIPAGSGPANDGVYVLVKGVAI